MSVERYAPRGILSTPRQIVKRMPNASGNLRPKSQDYCWHVPSIGILVNSATIILFTTVFRNLGLGLAAPA
jgi:hypothetical protein